MALAAQRHHHAALGAHPMARTVNGEGTLTAGGWLVLAFIIGALFWLAVAWGLFVMLAR
jgi:hypothetical protein